MRQWSLISWSIHGWWQLWVTNTAAQESQRIQVEEQRASDPAFPLCMRLWLVIKTFRSCNHCSTRAYISNWVCPNKAKPPSEYGTRKVLPLAEASELKKEKYWTEDQESKLGRQLNNHLHTCWTGVLLHWKSSGRRENISQLGKAMAPFEEDAWAGIPVSDCML